MKMKEIKMSNIILIVIAILSFLLMLREFSNGINPDVDTAPSIDFDFNESFTLEEMLNFAIQEEYYMKAQYSLIQEIYDEAVFVFILAEEDGHIEHLLEFFRKYNFEEPPDLSYNKTVVPNSITEAYKIGIIIETNNIRMYNNFLSRDDLPTDVRAIFKHLVESSNIHLLEFQNTFDYHYK